ncbi:MAG: hypothetical protein HY905_15745 [Deltaproteobacteria bacterium]|nr:hypothetical protein [Deltaproteobacteria bacterium]
MSKGNEECPERDDDEPELLPPPEVPGWDPPPPKPSAPPAEPRCPNRDSCPHGFGRECRWATVSAKTALPDGWGCDLFLKYRAELEELDAKHAHVPRRFWKTLGIGRNGRFDGLVPTQELVEVEKHDEGILVLAGPSGVGKSLEAAWWAYLHDGLFVRGSELARANWYEDTVVRRLLRVWALVIDDVGVEYDDVKGNWRSRLDEVLCTRHDDCCPTIVTTNLPPEQFRSLVGDRVWDRIKDGGRFHKCVRASLRSPHRGSEDGEPAATSGPEAGRADEPEDTLDRKG